MIKNNCNIFLDFLKLDRLEGGIILIDKPTNWTSHDVVAKIRRLTGFKKIGHSGTLDPLATGLLIVLVGKKFTKQQDSFLKLDKEYVCTAQFGIETDSYDIEGKIIKEASWSILKNLTKQKIEEAMIDFRGDILQKVPAFSAVKLSGKKLYNLARKNQLTKVELPQRQVSVYDFKLLKLDILPEKRLISAEFNIKCASGTYIRSLIHDLGQKLETGATITALRRTKIDKLSVDNSIKMQELLNLL
jgi:tRNA pseudouridine55 synthase